MAAILASGLLALVFPEASAQAQHNAPTPAPAPAKPGAPHSPVKLAAQAAQAAKAKAEKEKVAAEKAAAEKKLERKPGAPTAPVAPTATVTEPEPPGAKGELPSSMDAIAKAVSTPYKPQGGGHLVKFNLEDADLAELVNHISGLTGKRFIYGQKVRQIKVTVVSPTEVTLDEAYEAFLAILQSNGMTVVPQGRFLKIVDSATVVADSTPIYSRGAPIPDTGAYVTRLYRLKYVPAVEAQKLLTKFKTKEGDVTIYEPGQLVIMTDTGSNIQRMVRLVEEIDVGGVSSQMWIEPIHYGGAQDMAKQINDLFQLDGKGGGTVGGLSRVVADDLTNSLIVVGTEDSYLRLLELLKRIDTAPAAEGKIHVLPLQNAVAEELAQTLNQMISGVSAKGAKGAAANTPPAAAAASTMFEGEIRVTADKATNALLVTSSGRDYAQLRLVIEKLDQKRRQVFIEAVIMDVEVSRANTLGLAYHAGTTAQILSDQDSLIMGSFNGGIPGGSIATDPTSLNALALGVRGPEIEGTQNLPGLPAGISIPAFGVVLNAVAQDGDTNVLSTPHIIATDNTEAEIRIGQNIPLQTNVGGLGGLSSLSGIAGAAASQSGAASALNSLGGLGGLLGGGFSAQRQDVGTKVKITPHINDKNQVRLEIEEEISNPGAPMGALGAVPIQERTAQTTVIVDDQQTVVIGGLIRDSLTKQRTKIPVLGDLPVLGFLFRQTSTTKQKSNLLLILTPYVIHDQNDLRKVFERKMQERQEFLDRYFVFNSQWEPPRDFSRANGLVEEVRQAFIMQEERQRLEEESKPKAVLGHVPSAPIELPEEVEPADGGSRGSSGGGASPAQRRAPSSKPAAKPRSAPKRAPEPRRGGRRTDVLPVRINPIARNVNVEQGE
jgi:general secretion pathway protein D